MIINKFLAEPIQISLLGFISFYMKDEFYNIFNLVIALHHDKENISRPCSALMMYVKLMHYIKYKH